MTAPWEPLDLLLTADDVVVQLHRAVDDGEWLDAYLLAAGLHQLVEDRLHPDPFQLRRAAEFLRGRGARAARGAGLLAGSAARLLEVQTASRSLREIRDSVGEAAVRLAAVVLGHDPGDAGVLGGIGVPRIAEVLRVPSCFRSFDQHPDDMALLAQRYVRRFGPGAPVCVIGVRTSGSYLAPLCVAALRARGVDANWLSYRPGRALRGDERRLLREVAARGGRVAVVDDPPVSGRALAATAFAIGRMGVPDDRIVMLLALADAEPPPALRDRAAIYLPWSEWTVHQRLQEPTVAASLGAFLGHNPHQVKARALPRPSSTTQRGRVRARYAVTITGPTGETEEREIAVEGAGLGFFGRHAVTVATRLPQHCPRTYGLVDGLLYREWVPGTGPRPDEDHLATCVVRYVADRGRALRVTRDPVARLRGRQPAWEVAAGLLSGTFGRFAPAGQVLLLDRIARDLLRTTTPSVPDGQTDTRFWLPGQPLRKVGFDERSFGNLELGCYDEVFDLAGAAADPPSVGFEAILRTRYEHETGRSVDVERWLLYRLAHLWRMRRAGDLDPRLAAELSATAIHDYLAAVLDATDLDGGGDLCAVDLDGVLETDPLGFPCTAPTALLALRALARHGFRPVIVTGRSVADAAVRCTTFGLAGAVAEYGTVAHDQRSRTSTDLRDDAARRAVDHVRRRLGAIPDLELDDRYEHVVRARHRGGPLPDGIVRGLGHGVRIVQGDGQTDIVPAGIDKGTGLRHLASRLAPDRQIPRMAVGDTAEDLPMFLLARTARAPRNADAAVRAAGVRLTRHGYQAGLADACAELLGHRTGCPTCRPPYLPPRSSALLTVLGLREDGVRGLPIRAARLGALATRSARW